MVAFHGLGMPSFDYDGLNSLEDFDIRLTSKPLINTPEMRREEVVVPGRDSVLTFTDGTYEDITIKVGGRIRNLESSLGARMDRIKRWLMFTQLKDKHLTFSHFPQWAFLVRFIKPYEWEYHSPTGEYSTEFEFTCRPYKVSNSYDEFKLTSSTGASEMSPWKVFKATDKDWHGTDIFRAGSYEVLDGEALNMMYGNNLLEGDQNRNDQLYKLAADDGEGIDNFLYAQSEVVSESNCLYSFYDKTNSLNINTPQWHYDSGIKIVNGHTLKVEGNQTLLKATSTFQKNHFKLAGKDTYYISGKSINHATKISVKELKPDFSIVKSILGSGTIGDSFDVADVADGNLIRVEIEFPYSSYPQQISELIISPREYANYSPRWKSYSATHVSVDVTELARIIDPAIYRTEDNITTKLNKIQSRKPEFRFTSTSTLSQSSQWESFENYHVTKYAEYKYPQSNSYGKKMYTIDPLRTPNGGVILVEQALETDNRMHFLQLARAGSAPHGNIGRLNNKLDEVMIEMRMEVPPTYYTIYDNTDGIDNPLEIVVNVKHTGAILFSADVSGKGESTSLELNFPPTYLDREVFIDTETYRVYAKDAAGKPISLTNYCKGDFPKCWKGTRVQYQIDSKFNTASFKIRKRSM